MPLPCLCLHCLSALPQSVFWTEYPGFLFWDETVGFGVLDEDEEIPVTWRQVNAYCQRKARCDIAFALCLHCLHG